MGKGMSSEYRIGRTTHCEQSHTLVKEESEKGRRLEGEKGEKDERPTSDEDKKEKVKVRR